VNELPNEASAQPAKPTIFFDGVSSRRRQVTLALGDALEIVEEGGSPVRWAYADIRRADSPPGILRLASMSAPPLARLEIRDAAGLDDDSMTAGVLPTSVPNAFALPGGKVYLLKGLLDKAENPDEIAGILAHELGHLKHHDNMRGLIYNGGTSFLIGLLFGDVTGSSAVIFASRSVVEASYSREAETAADTFAIEIMHKLGRSPKPAAELMFRITGKEGGGLTSILASHPLTEDRLARMTKEDRPASGPPLLTDAEWRSLKGICGSGKI